MNQQEESSDEEDEEEESSDEEEEDDDDETDANNKASNEAFLDLCLRLAKNDDTLCFMNDWSKDVGVQNRGKRWKDTELMLLGKSLLGNTHLQSLSFRVESCVCEHRNAARFVPAMQEGVAQLTKLRALQLVQVCCQFQTRLLEGAGKCSSLERLELCDEQIYNMRVLANLLLLPKKDTTLPTPPPISSSSSIPATQPSGGGPCQLTHLGLRNCKIDNLDMLALSLGLANNRTLQFLNLEKNMIGNVGIAYFCHHYWKSSSIDGVVGGDSGNGDSNADHSIIILNTTVDCPLQELDLSWNRVGTHGAFLLLQATTRHPAMRKLLLTGNGEIGPAGLQLMGQQLPHTHLQYLEIHQVVDVDMPWTDWSQPDNQAAARALADGLRQNTTLVQFHVGANVLGPTGAQRILQAIAVHPKLHTLGYASDGSLGFAGLRLVGQELGHTRLKQIHLDGIIFPWPEDDDKQDRAARNAAGQALVNGVTQNVHMTFFTLFGMNERFLKPIEFYMNVNKKCRPLFRNEAITAGMWPFILALFSGDKTSQLYFCLREQPWLINMRRM